MNPLKQGLKRGAEYEVEDKGVWIKEVNPLKQGLKPDCCK